MGRDPSILRGAPTEPIATQSSDLITSVRDSSRQFATVLDSQWERCGSRGQNKPEATNPLAQLASFIPMLILTGVKPHRFIHLHRSVDCGYRTLNQPSASVHCARLFFVSRDQGSRGRGPGEAKAHVAVAARRMVPVARGDTRARRTAALAATPYDGVRARGRAFWIRRWA